MLTTVTLGESVDPATSMLRRVRQAGLKLTPQRVAIVREMAEDPTHPTAQELYERLLPTMPTMSFATVYNTLDSLAIAGLIKARAFSKGATRFDPNVGAHDHAVCDRCGKVRDIAAIDDDVPPTATPVPSATKGLSGFRVLAVEKVFRGICLDCQPEGDPSVDTIPKTQHE